MKAAGAVIVAGLVLLGGFGSALAADFKEKVKVEVLSVGLHPDMDPGMYVCAGGHLHIKGTAQNLAGVPLGPIKVAGRAFGADDHFLGEATFSTKQPVLRPEEKTEINLEFLTVTGLNIQRVKKHEILVVEAPAKELTP